MKTKKAKSVKKAKKPTKQTQVRSKAARANIAEGTRLFALAGRPTKAQFTKVYRPKGPNMTWAHTPRLQQLHAFLLTTNVSNKSGNLLSLKS